MEIVEGKIIQHKDGGFIVAVPYTNIDRAVLRHYSSVQVGLPDGRSISPDQRKKAYALMNEIAEWMGDLPEYVKRLMKMEFMINRMQALQKQMFSLSDCDVTTAREFITYLIDFIIAHDVPTQKPLYELCDDIDKYVYACLIHKKCAVCGAAGELHHVEAIGMGRDRDGVYQIGMPVISLCRIHHSESHTIGQQAFMKKYWLQPVELTKEIGKKYKLTKRNLEG